MTEQQMLCLSRVVPGCGLLHNALCRMARFLAGSYRGDVVALDNQLAVVNKTKIGRAAIWALERIGGG